MQNQRELPLMTLYHTRRIRQPKQQAVANNMARQSRINFKQAAEKFPMVQDSRRRRTLRCAWVLFSSGQHTGRCGVEAGAETTQSAGLGFTEALGIYVEVLYALPHIYLPLRTPETKPPR